MAGVGDAAGKFEVQTAVEASGRESIRLTGRYHRSSNGANGANGASHALPDLVTSASAFLEHDYDYVIIGGGTAGLVLAARLTENPDISVGVLEAGKNKLDDPLEGMDGIVHNIPRGKVLGGSSGINYMMYVRGSERDYDDWAALSGDPGWSFANMRQYITKHQTLEPIPDSITNRAAMSTIGVNHGTNGPIHTSFNDTRLPIEDAFLAAADQAAHITEKPVDAWGGDHYGFYNGLGSVYHRGSNEPHSHPLAGKRSYAARGYFSEAGIAHRPNLRVLCEARVTRILLSDHDDGEEHNKPSAVGVAFTHASSNGQNEVRAKREVLLCAGAIQSPQVLELSGIGDPGVLARAGVDVKVPLPSVGENFQDHVVTGAAYGLAPGVISGDSLWHPQAMAEAQRALVEQAAGPLTATASGQGFVSYKQLASKEELDKTIASIRETQRKATAFQQRQLDLIIKHLEDDKSANIQYILIPAHGNLTDESIKDQSKLWMPGDPAKPEVVWGCALQYPVSRGSVHISSAGE
ncbi:hypothetical protein SLS55_004585 [Diplodia seriata]|uniref:Glucose-methanol-choline oxidoreductase N-terminal domain-containing protein n=1 Tax=Diplodia seriata TaxID=420778 RepID=A0ABR3CJT8_9PEZI